MTYLEMLKQEFIDRKGRRPAYSERAFARDLKVSPGYVSLLFRGQRSLSPVKGFEIARRLSWTDEKSAQFVASIQNHNLDSSKSIPKKKKPSVEVETKFVELEHDAFRFIADLNHLATLTLIQSRKKIKPAEVYEVLEISTVEADLILLRLRRLGLIKEEVGFLKPSKNSLEIKEVPSEAIRTLHRMAIQKAEASIEGQTVQERNLAALTLSFDVNKMVEAKAFINRFLKTFEKKFGNAPQGEIYQMNTQLFKLSKRGPL